MVLHTIDSGRLRISVDETGAELSSMRDETGRELLWQGQSVWKRRAPILFPIIGQMPGGVLRYQGVSYPIGQHGFARDERFEASDLSSRSVLFSLVDSPRTRAQFPFRFRLEVLYSVTDATLSVTTTVTNTDSMPFAASLGEHPALLVATRARNCTKCPRHRVPDTGTGAYPADSGRPSAGRGTADACGGPHSRAYRFTLRRRCDHLRSAHESVGAIFRPGSASNRVGLS